MEDFTSESSIDLLDGQSVQNIQEQIREPFDMPPVGWTQLPQETIPHRHNLHPGRSAVMAPTFDPVQTSASPEGDRRPFIGPSSIVDASVAGNSLGKRSQSSMIRWSKKQNTVYSDTAAAPIRVSESDQVHDAVAPLDTLPQKKDIDGFALGPVVYVADTAWIGDHLGTQFPTDMEDIADKMSLSSYGSIGFSIDEPVAAPLMQCPPNTTELPPTYRPYHDGTHRGILQWRRGVLGKDRSV